MPTIRRSYSWIFRHCFLSWMLLILTVELCPISAFNLELESLKTFSDPSVNRSRDTYFGFSVALLGNTSEGTPWLVVGAPRANSTQYDPRKVTEPGALFKCNLLDDSQPCQELKIDQYDNKGGSDAESYIDKKDRGWLGASLDSQPISPTGHDRKATGVCAPRWINQFYTNLSSNLYMAGACYWLNESLPDSQAHKRLPLISLLNGTYNGNGRNLHYYAHGQAGISLHFPDDNTEMIIGAPGILNWKGSVIRLKDSDTLQAHLPNAEDLMFSSKTVFNPQHTKEIDEFGLNGYSVTSGRFFNQSELLYASGAPRAANSFGKVFIFAFPTEEQKSLDIRQLKKGEQLGESFGASVVSADVNGDDFSDLVVGCPTFFDDKEPDMADMGRIQFFLGGQDGVLEVNGFRSGSRSPSARFGTTLAPLGDLNHDKYEDVAVGAPFEDNGKGAVYIYLGAESGLRKVFSQRISPKDFPSSLNLDIRGFGMGISRGVDIDSNGYTDLAIGSFLSGHAVVLKSRTVASLTGHLESNPPALSDDATSFKLIACIKYDGFNVPQKVDIEGRISLDIRHPSPRTTFRDNSNSKMDINVTRSKGDEDCITYDVDIKANTLDPRRPIVVKLEQWLVDTAGVRMTLPKTDPKEEKGSNHSIGVLTDCDDDDNPICLTNMTLKASFVNYREEQKVIIGGNDRPELEITLNNYGESVFLPRVTVQVQLPLALFMPTSHSCHFPIRGKRSVLVCQLANPIKRDSEDTVKVIVDTSSVKETTTNELQVSVQAAGEGDEVDTSNNNITLKLQLQARAELQLQGYSRDEYVFYQRIGENQINTTKAKASFTHHYTVMKSGPTPVGKVDLVVDIPVAFTEGVNFITLHPPETNFQSGSFICDDVIGATWSVDNLRNVDSGLSAIARNDVTLSPEGRNDDKDTVRPYLRVTKSNKISSDDSSIHEQQTFKCSSDQVSCATLKCHIYSWPGGSHSAEFSVRMDVSFVDLATHISAEYGAIVRSTATASIDSFSQDLAFEGTKNTSGSIDTQILPDSLASQDILWWIILLAVLGSLLLLGLLILLLYKLGFFERKERDEMAAHRALVVASNNEGPAS